MRALLNLFIDICLFRKGPQDLPHSTALLKLCLLAYCVSGWIILLIDFDQLSVFSALLMIVFDLALLACLCYGVLYILGYSERFIQTLTALTGVSVLVQIIATPIVLWAEREWAEQQATGQGNPEAPILLHFMLLGWTIAVMAHILQQAFSTSRGLGVLYAILYFAITWTLFDWLLPTPMTVS